MKQIVVGIIGDKGRFGIFLRRLFIDFGCEVIGSDVQSSEDITASNRKVVEKADVVIFSVLPRKVVEVINSLLEYSRPDQLWMDVTSLKEVSIKAMLNSRAEVVGLHPMCAPTTKSLRGQKVIVCFERLNNWRLWIEKFLEWTGAKLKFYDKIEHDRRMAIVQGLIHIMQLTTAATIRDCGEDVSESLEFTSPVYRIALSSIGRILKQNPELYADIQMLNLHIPSVLRQAEQNLKELRCIVEQGDQKLFIEEFLKSKNHFGNKNLDEAFDLFEELNQLLADRSSERQVALCVQKDHPGVLHEISGIFAEYKINLTHIHSFKSNDGSHRFLVGLDCSGNTSAALEALKKIDQCGLARVIEENK